jgi:hypothetical protein
MKILWLFLLFILCVLLPRIFKLLEGNQNIYSTELLDNGPHSTSPIVDGILMATRDISFNMTK